MVELAQAGEPGVGLENFCTQLFEYDIAVPVRTLTEIVKLACSMGIQSCYWERLKKGPPS